MTGISLSPRATRWLKRQQLFLAISVAVYAMFWAIGVTTNVLVVVIYSFFLGNIGTLIVETVTDRVGCEHPGRQWAVFFPALLVGSAIAVVASTYLVYWVGAPPRPPFGSYLQSGWKFPMLITLVVGLTLFLYETTKTRLEDRNKALQRSVELEAAQRELQEQELQRAREIQQSLLPKEIPQVPGFEIEGAWEPARVVGGDYFDVIRLGEKKIAICIADVVGKSVSAALLMASVQATVRAFAADAKSPAALCSRVNAVLCNNIASGKFVTMFYGVLDAESGVFEYSNAGHSYPLRVSSDGVQTLNDSGAVLGVLPEWKYQDASVRLGEGDRLLLFTDGITEASTADGEEFGEERVAKTAVRHAAQSVSEMKQRLLAEVKEFCDSQLQDDATLVIVGRN